MIGYLRLQVLSAVRDPRYLMLAVAAPIGFYLLFSALFGQDTDPAAGGVKAQVLMIVSMSVFGAMWAVLSATGPRVAQERSIGWLRQLRLLPVRSPAILAGRLLAALVVAGPAIVLVFITGAIAHGVSMEAWRWTLLLAVIWLGIVPVGALGLVIGYAADAEVAFGIVYGLYMVLAALGGLWMPMSILPSGLQTIGKLLPSYRVADIGWRILAGRSIDVSSMLILIAWTAGCTLLALFFARRTARSR
jgi:ABC-2 type transport system permease protein